MFLERSVPETLDAILALTVPGPGGCMLWTGKLNRDGYVSATINGWPANLHRHVYQLVNGTGPLGRRVDVRHSCDVRHCINPAHLLPGTRRENMQDAVRRGRIARGFRKPNTKAGPEQVAQIEARARAGEPYKSIAVDFGLTQQRVGDIARKLGIRRY